MTSRSIAFLGISGVGKTTLLTNLSGSIRFRHLRASSLIQRGSALSQRLIISPDNLRTTDINDNQELLLAGFREAATLNNELIVLDGHSLIDAPGGFVPIDAGIFREMGIAQIIFVVDQPARILARRQGDIERRRPHRSSDELNSYQAAALAHAIEIGLELSVPVTIITPEQLEYAATLLFP